MLPLMEVQEVLLVVERVGVGGVGCTVRCRVSTWVQPLASVWL